MSKYTLIIASFLLITGVLRAQNKWQSKGTLYSDKNINVEIEYLLSPDGCAESNSNSYFRYRITRINAVRNYYINWRFDFFNCNNELKTQVNSLNILKQTKVGVFTPEINSFIAKKMSNYLNDVKVSRDLPKIGSYKPISALSMEPIAINGVKNIHSGESATLTLEGGSLGTGASWMWYEGACSGKPLGTGSTLTLTPEHSLMIFVRAEGPKPSSCISTQLSVRLGSVAPSAILGRTEICEGEQNITLSLSGGKLYGQAKWIWYAGNCAGEKIGEGQSVNVSPLRTTTYYVRAENGEDKTICKSLQLTVNNKSMKPASINGLQSIRYGSESNLKIIGGYLAQGSQWVWYKGIGVQLKAVGKGTTFSTGPLYANEVFSVRAEGQCNQTELISHAITIANSHTQTRISKSSAKSSFFINGGIAFTEASNIGKSDNYVLTIGSGGKIGWFAKAKSSIRNRKASFETNDNSISEYNVPGYYNYNGQTINKRSAYTAGMFFGGYKLSGYLGGGYGTKELLWGIDQYHYDNNGYYSSSFAKNTANSYKGAELELGLMLRLGFLNLMGGASSIQFKYTDFNIGVGFNL